MEMDFVGAVINLVDQPLVLLRWLLNDRQPGWHGGDQPVPITFMLLARVAVVASRSSACAPYAVRAFGCRAAIVLMPKVFQRVLAGDFLTIAPGTADRDQITAVLGHEPHLEGFTSGDGLEVS